MFTNSNADNKKRHRPIFSVIIPTYNRADLVSRAIQSVLSQTLTDFELIVVDDGSTDKTKEAVVRLKDTRIQYIYQQNKGRCAARNIGAAQARGQYLTFLDSDDEALPEWLSHFVDAFRQSQTGIVCVGYIRVLLENGQKKKAIFRPEMRPVDRQKGLFLAGTFAMRRELFEAIGGYAETIAFAENTELALRLVPYCWAQGLEVVNLDQPLLVYNRHSVSRQDSEEAFKVGLEAAKYILSHHRHRLLKEFPRGYANYCVIAGVNAARLKQYHEARGFFFSAVRHYPWNLRHYGRLLLVMFPFLGRKLWLRHSES
jgi:glycosyltransferase involved in cell wall biosynthesis